MFIFTWMIKIIDRLFTLACALGFVQIPLFINEYMHQLVGRQAELRLYVEAMQKSAAISNKSLEQYINKFLQSADIDFIQQGNLMESMVERFSRISDALSSLQTASLGTRPFVFMSHLDSAIFQSTFKHFTIGVPFTWEGAIYAIVGVVIGYCLFSCLRPNRSKIAQQQQKDKRQLQKSLDQ